eukprot:4737650-Karenia_brevis.AAC.1
MSESNVFKEITATSDLYTQEPSHLASFDLRRLKILGRTIFPQDARQRLPRYAVSYLDHFSDLIERDEISMEKVRQTTTPIKPYWDPKLARSRDLRDQLYLALYHKGLLGFRYGHKAFVSAFVVKKKDGWQRLILDARQANRGHNVPPTTRLSSASCMIDIDMSEEAFLSGGYGGLQADETRLADPAGQELDIGDCYYNYLVPEVASWFVFNDPDTADSFVKKGFHSIWVYKDVEKVWEIADPTATVYPSFQGIPMGWSWGLFFANESTAHMTCTSQHVSPDNLLRERSPTPPLKIGHVLAGVYVDNVPLIGGRSCDVQLASAGVVQRAEEMQLPIETTYDGSSKQLAALGL